MNKICFNNNFESGINESDIRESAEKIKSIIINLIKNKELEAQIIVKELDQIKIEIKKLNIKIDTLIALRNASEIDKNLEEIISSFKFLLETKEVLQESLLGKIQQLKLEKEELIYENKNLIEKVDKDDLTQVFNRGKFKITLEKAFNTAINGKHKQLTLAIIDIDNFKGINDRFGHTIGDNALIIVAKLLKNIFRINLNTAIFRYGGEEFAIISQGDFGEIHTKMSLFLKTLKQQNILKDTHEGQLNITASIGLSQFNEQLHSNPEDLVNDADKKMYVSKNNGKDQITV